MLYLLLENIRYLYKNFNTVNQDIEKLTVQSRDGPLVYYVLMANKYISLLSL